MVTSQRPTLRRSKYIGKRYYCRMKEIGRSGAGDGTAERPPLRRAGVERQPGSVVADRLTAPRHVSCKDYGYWAKEALGPE